MQAIVTLKKLKMRGKIKKKKSTYGVMFFTKPVNLLQQNMSPPPLMLSWLNSDKQDWWSIINQWVGVDVIDTAWK